MHQSSVKTYAKAMVEVFDGLSEKEAKKRAQNWKHLLYKRGASKQVSKILQEFVRAWKERKGKEHVGLQSGQSHLVPKKNFFFSLTSKRLFPSFFFGRKLFTVALSNQDKSGPRSGRYKYILLSEKTHLLRKSYYLLYCL